MEQIFPFGLQLQFFIAAAGQCEFDSTVAQQEVQPAPAWLQPPPQTSAVMPPMHPAVSGSGWVQERCGPVRGQGGEGNIRGRNVLDHQDCPPPPLPTGCWDIQEEEKLRGGPAVFTVQLYLPHMLTCLGPV